MSEEKYVVNLSLAEKTYLDNIKKRKLILSDEIDELMVEDFIMYILEWNEEDEGLPEEERKPITVYLNSPGGEVFIGLVMAEIIKKSKTPVYIVALSLAASMGSVILASGHKRMAYKYSNILIHDGSTMVAGTTKKVNDHMAFYQKKNEQIKEFIIANSNISSEKYDDMEDREWWMTADEAIELGVIDEIIQ